MGDKICGQHATAGQAKHTAGTHRRARMYLAKHPHLYRLVVRYYIIKHAKWRHLTARWRRLPDFIIIGGTKCGTTSLYDFIVHHPDIEAARAKELVYWSDPIKAGLNFYRANFPLSSKKRCLTGEADPTYFDYPGVPAQMKAALPNVKLIVILRDPVERAYSYYHDSHRDGNGDPGDTFEKALKQEEARRKLAERAHRIISSIYDDNDKKAAANVNMDYLLQCVRTFRPYTAYGHYADHLEKWFEHYPKEQFLILSTTDLKRNRQTVLDEVYDFLGVRPHAMGDAPNLNVGRYEPIKEETRCMLAEHFAPYNERLYRMVGRDFGWQCGDRC